ncbi:limulus clotting factor C-like isoform X2 [Stegodyphus dumicola]|uniref:limulus clotting factor C-like isoform X2 n=1 Tax=Stegodyphus dumicola TaxID=202533 RepID=UPI0015B19C70|nr:limulus clotting factor C-like isoform X2 [Stegodyphus dumicola]
MKSVELVASAFLLGAIFQICTGKGVNLGVCDDTYFTCTCGQSDVQIKVKIKRCSYSHRWKITCKPCNKLKESDVCPKYQACKQCHADGGDSCATCPDGKFGTWCENVCTCVNGGVCERDGKCICSQGYEGRNCERKKGCSPPGAIAHPLQVTLSPAGRPVTAVYSCPEDYELSGSAVSTCLPGDKWSSEPPVCLKKCPLLSAPANGKLEFSANVLVEGVTADITCNAHHRLIGQKTLACLANGQWNTELPVCEELASCPDPGNVQYADRTILPGAVKRGGHFVQNSKIQYSCKPGFELMGEDTILCLFDKTWSSEPPSCIKVSTIVPDCFTPGSQVVSDVGVSVRIVCPPECADEDFSVWGTSIYRGRSSVCQAAIHSAKITNSGGAVAVINNGPYSHFTGSDSNNIESESFDDRDESFRFDKLPPMSRSVDSKVCEKGLMKLENICAYVSKVLRNYKEAEAVCTNLGLQLDVPKEEEEKLRLITILNSKGIRSVWSVTEPETSKTTNNSIAISQSSNLCSVLTINDLDFKKEERNCNEFLSYVCVRKSQANSLAICEDPGLLVNGKAEPIGRIEGVYYVGSSIEYKCEPLHYLKGADVISCTANGSWSLEKPTCIKVDACEEPPVPIGGFVTYLPPLKNPTEQRAAIGTSGVIGTRLARLPAGLAAPLPKNLPLPTSMESSLPESLDLPSGVHRLGTRAMYDCESRYYKLIGSRTRRCQGRGQWSGRPPTCIPVCGKSDSPRSPFIVNGNATDIGQWPWQGGIARYLPDYNRWFLLCGASLLNEIWLITAAHCVTYAGTTLTIEPSKFQVYLGKYHRKDSKDDEYVQVRKIQEIHIHPDYDPGLFDADIALLQMDSPVQLNSRVQPICLPTEQTTRENIVEGKKGVVTGWGMNENDTYAETLQQAVLPVVSQERCEQGYEESDLPLTVTDNMFCAGYEQGKADACSGDSGGPMVFTDDSSKERKWVLEGIVSWGSPGGCGHPKQYGGFTTVSRFLDWIHLYF